MTATRLRRAFKYPSDDEISSDGHDEMDEQEQEDLLTSLQTQSLASNRTFTVFFTVLPLLPIPVFILAFLTARITGSSIFTPSRTRLLNLLCITSLLSTSFDMFFLTPSSVSETAKSARERLLRQAHRQKAPDREHVVSRSGMLDRVRDGLVQMENKLDDLRVRLDSEGPLMSMLPWLNGLICGVLAVTVWVGSAKGGLMILSYLLLPGIMAGIVKFVQWNINSERQALDELGQARYELKGA